MQTIIRHPDDLVTFNHLPGHSDAAKAQVTRGYRDCLRQLFNKIIVVDVVDHDAPPRAYSPGAAAATAPAPSFALACVTIRA